jgi:hypothetical protein
VARRKGERWWRWQPGGSGSVGGGGGGRRLAAKAAGDESVDGLITASDDESGQRTTMQ